MTTTAIDLLDSLRAHLGSFDLPAPCSVTVMTYSAKPNATMQLARQEPAEIAAGLLAWADTLTGITSEAWRDPTGDSVHLSITGETPDGVSIEVYGCLPFTKHGLGADLAPNATTTIPLVALRQLASLGEADTR